MPAYLQLVPNKSIQPAEKLLDALILKLSEASIAGFLMGPVVQHLQRQAELRFDMEGDEASGRWEELKESTLRLRESKGFLPGPINERTGRLREFVVTNPGMAGRDIGSTVEWPTGIPDSGDLMYSYMTAQFGSTVWHTPARPVAAMDFADMAAINLLFGGFMEKL